MGGPDGGTTVFDVSKLEINGILFHPAVIPPGSTKSLFLAGAGERGMEIGGKFIVFTAIGVYLEDVALESLAGKWKGKAADELCVNPEFYRDIFTGNFEKFTRVTMVLPLTGQQYSEKVSENCVNAWKAAGIYTEAEEAALVKFKDIFKDQNFSTNASILFTHSPNGSLTIAFSMDGSIPEVGEVIENKTLCDAVLESIIGQHGVSPAAKKALAVRLSDLLKEPPQAEEVKADNSVNSDV